jgi:hypothetical protein
MKRKLSLLLASLFLFGLFAACTGNGDPSPTPAAPGPGDNNNPGDVDIDPDWDPDIQYDEYIPPPSDAAMELDILMWSGSGTYLTDLGNQNWAPEDIRGQNEAAAYAVAKEFKKLYPNVKINILAVSGAPEDAAGGAGWAQEMENFRAERGKYPDLFCTVDMVSDVKKGFLADISVFENDPVYRSFNKSVLMMTNYNGRQFALPQYLLPWGIYVNKTLADNNNINIPDPDWTIDEYTRFVSNSDPEAPWFGAMDAERGILMTSSKGFAYNLVNRKPGDPFVMLDTPEFYKLMEYIPGWANHAAYPQNDLGNVPEGFMGEHWWWPYRFFQQGKLLTLAGDPWMMGDQANPNPESTFYVSWDWDIYPRPSTAELGNTVGVVLDPFGIHNFQAYVTAGTMTQEEADLRLKVCYELLKFWCADSRSWQARADQMWLDGTALKTSLNDSLPLVTGAKFNEQMEIWYSTETHKRFADKSKMPGFHAILELWEDGQIWDVSDKAYAWTYEAEGSSRLILHEYDRSWDIDIVGATRTDANWLDNVKARMPDWNRQFNERWAKVYAELDDAIERYYS